MMRRFFYLIFFFLTAGIAAGALKPVAVAVIPDCEAFITAMRRVESAGNVPGFVRHLNTEWSRACLFDLVESLDLKQPMSVCWFEEGGSAVPLVCVSVVKSDAPRVLRTLRLRYRDAVVFKAPESGFTAKAPRSDRTFPKSLACLERGGQLFLTPSVRLLECYRRGELQLPGFEGYAPDQLRVKTSGRYLVQVLPVFSFGILPLSDEAVLNPNANVSLTFSALESGDVAWSFRCLEPEEGSGCVLVGSMSPGAEQRCFEARFTGDGLSLAARLLGRHFRPLFQTWFPAAESGKVVLSVADSLDVPLALEGSFRAETVNEPDFRASPWLTFSSPDANGLRRPLFSGLEDGAVDLFPFLISQGRFRFGRVPGGWGVVMGNGRPDAPVLEPPSVSQSASGLCEEAWVDLRKVFSHLAGNGPDAVHLRLREGEAGVCRWQVHRNGREVNGALEMSPGALYLLFSFGERVPGILQSRLLRKLY